MTRFEAIQVVASGCGDDLVVSTLGLPSRELCAIGDRALSFYMLGSYTQASAVGLGLAMTRSDRRVIVLDGDGSLLGSSILPVIAAVAPPNLTVVCLDNGVFGSTGNQPRPGLHTADLRRMASAAGFARTWCVHDRVELQSALSASHGTLAFVHARLLPGVSMVPEVPLGMAEIRGRFMESVGRLQSPSVRAGTTGSEFTTKNH